MRSPAGLHAGGEPDLLHVQLVLRRQQAHRLLQLGRQPGAAELRRPEPAHVRQEAVPVEELQPERRDRGRSRRWRRIPT